MADNRNMTARRMTLAKATSALALATGLALGASGPAHAQAFEGNPTVISGGVGINRTPGIDDIRVDTDQAVINWTTNDTAVTGGPINFLPTGRTAFFRNNPTAQNFFTVLNRIIPTGTSRAVQFNGTIISQLQTAAGLVPGGNVWFYSPGGVVVNSTAVIDVGGLLLTSSDPVRDGNGAFINAAGSFTLGQAASASSVIVQPGAQIRATSENSYVAMVAPTVLQGGNVTVNGSAMYVGAEAATITFGGNGLFDIQVTTGTDGTGGLAVGHGGVTTGPASTGVNDNHRIYMVAVPKNNAITMAIGAGSRLGFDIAGAADVQGNSIILSSGYNVFGDFVDTSTAVNPAQAADISVSPADITSSFIAAASRNFLGQSLSGDLNFFSDVQAFGAGSAILNADGASASVNVGGNLTLSANDFRVVQGANAQAGTVRLRATNGGVISLSGNANLEAVGIGGSNFTSGTVGSGTGGLIEILANDGGLIAIAGSLRADASGLSGQTETTGVGSNFGRGGTIGVFTLGTGGTLLVDGTTELFAQGQGDGDGGSASGTGGAGFGGRIDVFAQGSGHLMRFGDAFLADVTGFGGAGANAGNGGAGQGGQIFVSTQGASTLDFLSDLSLLAFGFGGTAGATSGAAGGAATGGTASLGMGGTGGLINVGADAILRASANGGTGDHTGNLGGNAQGGGAIIFQNAVGGNLTISGATQVESFGIGGMATFGGNGTGGNAQVIAQNGGQLNLLSGLAVDGSGLGGTPSTPGIGSSGNGTGSSLAQIVALTGGVINVTGDVTVAANGAVFGSALAGIDGGNGTGGNASISQASAGRITINGNANVTAIGTGDANQGGGDGIAGNGTGGDARIAVNDLNITITGNATADARGFGGANLGGLRGGIGTGGLANLGAGAGTLSIGGVGTANADGIGGSSTGTGSGGAGVGGQAIIGSIPGGIIQIAGAAAASAAGFGGNASGTGNFGGLGDGGIAQIFANNGLVTVGGITTLNASGFGGSTTNGASSGAALGGLVSVLSQGTGQITLNQDVFLSAQALSGNVNDGAGNSAAATGGTVNVFALGAGGGITVNGSLFAEAITGVGSALTGTIGDALGGTVELAAGPGTINITGAVSLDATAFGGNSNVSGNGGNAAGGRTAVVIGSAGNGTINLGSTLTMASNAFGGLAHTGNGGNAAGGLSEGGSIDVGGRFTFGGAVSMNANGIGGDSVIAGNGGSGSGGTSRFGSNNTQMTGGDLFITADGRGGNGALGGRGGDATGGLATLVAGTGTVVGLLDFNNATLSASAFGGTGGAGASGATGGAGGAGGNATGGRVNVVASARNGQLDIGNLQVTMNGFGGIGGAGGTGTAGAGGTGGAGGIGTGGLTQIGTVSNTITNGPNPTPTGFMTMANAVIEANGFGGVGGDGGVGTTANGNGGNGGLGEAGGIFFATRGSLLQVDALTMIANGGGGNGGNGAVRGNGGNGISGLIQLGSTEQFQAPTNRGRLVAGDITAIARGTGGTGAVVGRTFYETGSFLQATNGDITANSIVFNIGNAGDAAEPTDIVEDFVRVTDATVNVRNSFTFITPGQLSTLINNGSLNAAAVGLVAGTFVPDTVVTAPTNIGTINATALALQSSGNLIVTANLNAVQDIAISVPGSVTLGNITGSGVIGITGGNLTLGNLVSGNHINLTSTSGAITAGNMTAANFIAMTAANGLTLGLATANSGYVDLLVNAGNLTVGNITAGTYIALETDAGNIAVGNTQSGEDTELDAVGSVQFGNVSTGLDLLVAATGNITGGNVNALGAVAGTTYSIGLLTRGGNIAVGNLSGARNVGFLSPGTITAGSVSSGQNIIVLGSGNIQFNGPVTGGSGATNHFYVGNASMASLLGADFNPAPLFSVTPVRTAGNLTINGASQVGQFVAGVGGSFSTTGAITANGGRVTINASSLSAQAITSTQAMSLLASNGNLSAGNLTSNTAINLLTNTGTVTAGTLSGPQIGIDSQGAVSIGGVTATGAATLRSRAGNFTSTGAITAASVDVTGAALTLNNVTATAGAINLTGASVTAQNLSSTLATQVTATNGNLQLGNIFASGTPTSGGVGLIASGTINAGAISTGTAPGLAVSIDGGGAVSIGGVTATGAANLRSRAGSFTSTGAITAAFAALNGIGVSLTNVTSTAGSIAIGAFTGNLTFGTLTSSTNTQFSAGGSVTGGDITAGSWIGTIVGGNMTLGNLRTTGPGVAPTSGFSIGLGANGAITTGTVNSFGSVGIGSDDGQGNVGNAVSITTGAITAGGSAFLRSTQGLTTGAITSTNEIRVRGGSVTTGALQATNAILAAAMTGNLNTGNVTTGTSAVLLASQSVNTGAISTGTTGTTLIANSSAISPTGLISTIDLNALLAATPVRVGGSVSIGAPVTTGTLLSASTGGFSASSAIQAGTRISLDVGGTAVFGGLAVAPTIAISSADIAFSQAGGLGNASTGTLTLTANRSGAVILGGSGDSQSQQGGYTLDGSEISRIRAQNIVINAPNVSSTGTGVEIRALTMNGSAATSGVNLNGSEGSLTINTAGTIRVNGNAVFNSMAATNRVALNAGRVEINADTGGIFLNGSSPGGVLSITANNIHIASASLLDQLASNVNFTGRDTALSLPIATSRPDGVIQASRLQFNVGSTLLIQNTGTSLLNAGFFGRVGSVQITPRSSQSTSNLIDMVIYGQLLDTGDIVRNGTSVRDLIFPTSTSPTAPGRDTPISTSGFTANSSVNGCLLSAVSCGGGGISEQGPTAVVHAGPPPPRPAEERQAEREQEEAEAAAEEAARGDAAPRRPIMPPVTIVNTRRLGVDPIIDEPVTSGGNPNLQLDQPLPDALPDTGGQP